MIQQIIDPLLDHKARHPIPRHVLPIEEQTDGTLEQVPIFRTNDMFALVPELKVGERTAPQMRVRAVTGAIVGGEIEFRHYVRTVDGGEGALGAAQAVYAASRGSRGLSWSHDSGADVKEEEEVEDG